MKTPYPKRLTKEEIDWLLAEKLVCYDKDSRVAVFFSLVMTFSDSQNLCFEVMWNNLLRGNLPLPQARILSARHGNSSYLSDLFRGRPCWGRVIVGDGKGNFWLHVPPEIISKCPSQ